MKKLLGVLVLVAVGFTGFSQQDYQLNQFFFDKVSLNPGATGMDGNCLGVFYRNQWTNFSGNPTTTLINYHQPVKVLRGGLGLTAFNDVLGNARDFQGSVVPNASKQMQNTAIRLNYSYHLKNVGGGTLGLGLSIGYQGLSLGSDWYAIDGIIGDEAINVVPESKGAADFNFGAFYQTTKFWAGLSSTHLSAPVLNGTTIDYDFARHYYFMTGYEARLNSNIMLYPSLLVKTEAKSMSLDLNVRAEFNQLFWAGISYRSTDAISPMAGISYNLPGTSSFNHTVRLGYSYDVTLSDIKNFSSGSHEIYLGYCWNFVRPVIRKSHGNPRFL